VYRRVGGIDRSKFFILDYDLFYRMWMATPFRKTRAFLGAIRVHDETKSARHDDVRHQEMAKAKAHYALSDPGYFRVRIMNRLDRIQTVLDTFLETTRGSALPRIGGRERGK
jgi:hypothetical protein